jgi:hypothetical protein
MTRFVEETFSGAYVSRPARVAVASKIALVVLAANLSIAAARAMFANVPQPAVVAESVSTVEPFILPVDYPDSETATPSNRDCRAVEVETDEGYGVRGRVVRYVCHQAL